MNSHSPFALVRSFARLPGAPGSDTPAYLENLTGSYGFDPLGLGKDAASLARFQESEVIHGRWAMLGVAGSLGAELAGQGDWYSAPLPLMSGGHAQYMGAEVRLS